MKKIKNYLSKKNVEFKMDGTIIVIKGSVSWPEIIELIDLMNNSNIYYSIHEGRFQIFKLK